MMDPEERQGTLTRRVRQPQREHRYVYGGDPRAASGGFLPRRNRRIIGRRNSTFNILLVLVCAGIAIVYYVNNIIVVNRLSYEVNQMKARYDSLMYANGVLQAEVSKKSSRERISAIAAEKLRLQNPEKPATYFRVDHELMNDLNARRER